MLNIFTVPAKVWTKCQVFLPCHISCTKSLGQSATCPRSFQLSRDQGSHPLITLPSQNKKARYSPQSHPDQRKLIKRVHVCLKSAKTTLNMENQVPTLTSVYLIVFTSFFPHFLKSFHIWGWRQMWQEVRCHDHKAGLGNSRHTQPPSSGPLPPSRLIVDNRKESVKYLL